MDISINIPCLTWPLDAPGLLSFYPSLLIPSVTYDFHLVHAPSPDKNCDLIKDSDSEQNISGKEWKSCTKCMLIMYNH